MKKGILSVRLGLGFGIGNLIGGAAGTVDLCGRKTPVLLLSRNRAEVDVFRENRLSAVK